MTLVLPGVTISVRGILWLGIAGAVAAIASVPLWTGSYVVHLLILTLFSVSLAVSYRLLLTAGLASFCHGAFYGIGAYTLAILTTKYGVTAWFGFLAAALVGAIAAAVIGFPSLRTRGAYFFLLTFGFLVVTNAAFANLKGLTGGFSGITDIPAPAGVKGVNGFFVLALGMTVLIILLFYLFDRSFWGLALRAIGSAPDLAASVGIDRVSATLAAFIAGAAAAGVTGGIYASYVSFVSPNSFPIWLSVYVLTYVVIGGASRFVGPIIGAAYVTLVPAIFSWSENYVAMFVAASIVAIMMVFPKGIAAEFCGLIKRLPGGRPSPAQTHIVSGTGQPSDARYPATARITKTAVERAPVLRVRGLDHAFGGVQTTRDVSFDVGSGEILGVIGPNGAGKTTLFNILSGYIRPRRGSIMLDGRSILGLAPHAIARRGLTRTFQASAVFDDLTVLENVLVAVRGVQRKGIVVDALFPVRTDRDALRLAEETINLVGLTPYLESRAGDLPYGLKKVLGFAVALPTEPRVLCLDEPFTGLNPSEVRHLVEIIRTVQARRNFAVLLVEHRMPIVAALCSRVIVLNFGGVIAIGSPAEIRAHPEVLKVYLGHGGRRREERVGAQR
jgi:ABC-type branched-subunit amino acid transport system ATPase component/ABC-type branched-subunit amino acid transport system permease subunit